MNTVDFGTSYASLTFLPRPIFRNPGRVVRDMVRLVERGVRKRRIYAVQAMGCSLKLSSVISSPPYHKPLVAFKPQVPLDSFRHVAFDADDLFQLAMECTQIRTWSRPSFISSCVDIASHVTECDLKIGEYLDQNFPISISSIHRELLDHQPEPEYEPIEIFAGPPLLHQAYNGIHAWIALVVSNVVRDRRRASLHLSLDQDQQTVSQTTHPKHIQFQASHSTTPKSAGSVANRKPTALPLRQ